MARLPKPKARRSARGQFVLNSWPIGDSISDCGLRIADSGAGSSSIPVRLPDDPASLQSAIYFTRFLRADRNAVSTTSSGWSVRIGEVVDLLGAAAGADALQKRLGPRADRRPAGCAARSPRRPALRALEQRHVLERKIELGRVEHVQHDHLVPAMAKVLQPGQHRLDVVEQVAEDRRRCRAA